MTSQFNHPCLIESSFATRELYKLTGQAAAYATCIIGFSSLSKGQRFELWS
jgi:hypothetical protein